MGDHHWRENLTISVNREMERIVSSHECEHLCELITTPLSIVIIPLPRIPVKRGCPSVAVRIPLGYMRLLVTMATHRVEISLKSNDS